MTKRDITALRVGQFIQSPNGGRIFRIVDLNGGVMRVGEFENGVMKFPAINWLMSTFADPIGARKDWPIILPCPRCEDQPRPEDDYICKRCRFG